MELVASSALPSSYLILSHRAQRSEVLQRCGHGEVRIRQFPRERSVDIRQIVPVLDYLQTTQVVIEGLLVTLPFLLRELLSDTVDDGSVELSVVAHQTTEIGMQLGDVRYVADFLECLNTGIETFEAFTKEILDFLERRNGRLVRANSVGRPLRLRDRDSSRPARIYSSSRRPSRCARCRSVS